MPVQGVSETASQQHADLCESEIDQRYRGLENQLYRIEIHQSGLGYGKEDDADKTSNDIANCAKFKWSRDNGSVIFPVLKMSPKGDHASVQLARVGRDARFSLKAGDWVEYYDEITILRDDLVESSDRNIFRKLLQVESVDAYDPTLLTLKGAAGDFDPPPTPPGWPPEASRPFLRRWDQRPARQLDSQSPMDSQQIRDSSDTVRSSYTNGLLVIAGPDLPTSTSTREEIEKFHKALNVGWLEIEHGIRIRFSPGFYRRGDYWLIPARYATGRVLWPTEPIDPARSNLGLIPADQPPRTTEHHYAPLAVVAASGTPVTDCRRIVTPASLPARP